MIPEHRDHGSGSLILLQPRLSTCNPVAVKPSVSLTDQLKETFSQAASVPSRLFLGSHFVLAVRIPFPPAQPRCYMWQQAHTPACPERGLGLPECWWKAQDVIHLELVLDSTIFCSQFTQLDEEEEEEEDGYMKTQVLCSAPSIQ